MSRYYRPKYGRRYVSDYYPPGEDDRGARDEGYYYEYCPVCRKRTEHESGQCLSRSHSEDY